MSEYRRLPSSGREVALLHVLFVPTFDVPASEGYLVTTASAGTVDRYSLECNFTWGNRSIRAARVTIHSNRTVEAANQTFNLAEGNLLVAHVDLDGTTHVTQVHVIRQEKDRSPEDVLADLEAQLPNDELIQRLKSH